MKRLILGCTLILAGVNGFAGWAIACVCRGNGGYSHVTSYLQGEHAVIASVFVIMAIAGLILALLDLRKGK